MRSRLFSAVVVVGLIAIGGRNAVAKDIQWSGYTWHVRSGDNGGPGPNDWSADNVWIDDQKRLHLKIAHKGDRWSCAEIWTDKRLGFGRYRFDVDSPAGILDDSVVLGLFNYPTDDIGPDGTNEIDIEYATWGGQQKEHGNFTVWPATAEYPHKSYIFRAGEDAAAINPCYFDWQSNKVFFRSGPETRGALSDRWSWTYAPVDYTHLIPQQPLPVHINLWLFNGKPPTDDKEVEIVISSFKFTPGNGQ